MSPSPSAYHGYGVWYVGSHEGAHGHDHPPECHHHGVTSGYHPGRNRPLLERLTGVTRNTFQGGADDDGADDVHVMCAHPASPEDHGYGVRAPMRRDGVMVSMIITLLVPVITVLGGLKGPESPESVLSAFGTRRLNQAI